MATIGRADDVVDVRARARASLRNSNQESFAAGDVEPLTPTNAFTCSNVVSEILPQQHFDLRYVDQIEVAL